jgi:hypothetical protein
MIEVVASDHVSRVLEGHPAKVIVGAQLPHAMVASIEVTKTGQRLLEAPGSSRRSVGGASRL